MMPLDQSKFLSADELADLGRLLDKYRLTSPRDCLIIEFAMKTGARASEIIKSTGLSGKEVGVRVKDIDKTRQTVFIRGLKGSNDRTIGISKDLVERLLEHSRTISSEYLFEICYQRLDQVWREMRSVNKKFHALRHTYAMNLYDKTQDIRLVQYALGHKNINNTLIYAQRSYGDKDFRRMAL